MIVCGNYNSTIGGYLYNIRIFPDNVTNCNSASYTDITSLYLSLINGTSSQLRVCSTASYLELSSIYYQPNVCTSNRYDLTSTFQAYYSSVIASGSGSGSPNSGTVSLVSGISPVDAVTTSWAVVLCLVIAYCFKLIRRSL